MNDLDNQSREQLLQEIAGLRDQVAELETSTEKLKQSEERLRQSEAALARERALLRMVIDLVPDSIYAKDAAGRKILTNRADLAYMGVATEAEALGKTDAEIFPLAMAVRFEADDEGVLQNGIPLLNREEILPRLDDQIRWVLTSKVPLRDETGQIIGLVGVGRDITERKQAEAALRESEEKFRQIVEHSGDGVMLADDTGRMVEFNPALERITGLVQAAITTWNAWDITFEMLPAECRTPAIYEQIKAGVQACLQTGHIPWAKETYEFEIQRPDGSYRTIQSADFSIKIGQGFGWGCIVRDVTERQQTEAALRQSEEKYRQLFTEMASGCALHEIICDDAGNAVDYVTQEVNAAFEALLNAKSEYVIGQKASAILPPQELKEWLAIFGPVALTARSSRYEMYSPLNQKYFEGSAYCPEKGKFAVTFTDVTDRRRAEKVLRESEERYRLLFDNMLEGFAYCRMYFDNDDRPVDFIYLDINNAFERLTGLKNVVGRRVSEVIPGIREATPKLFEIYGRVARTGQPERFEIDFTPLGMWLSISVYSTQRDYFVAVFDNITERKQAEIALRQSEQKFATAFHVSPDSININRLSDGVYIDINEGFTAITGYTREDVIGQSSLALNIWANPLDRTRLVQGLQEQGEVNNLEALFRMKDGTFRTALMSARLIEVDGERCILSLTRDITERKRAEETLRVSEQRFRSLFDSMQEMVVLHELIYDPGGQPVDYRILGCNPAFTAITAIPRDQAVGVLASQLYGTGAAPYLDIYAPVALTGQPTQFETFFPPMHKHFNISVFSPAGGQFATVTNDITERKQAEAAQRESLTKYRVLFESFPLGITMSDKAGNIVETNREAERLLGLAAEEHHRRMIHSPQWSIIRPDGSPMPPAEYASVRALQENCLIEHVEMGLVKGSGEVAWLDVTAAPIPLEDYGVAITYGDISARKQAEAAQAKLETQLRQVQKMETIGRLAGGVAHDFNNLLTVIIGHSGLMKARMFSEDPLFDDVEQIRQAAERAAALTRQLLAFSRQQVLAPAIIDLNSLVTNLQKMLKRVIGEDITLTTVLQPDLRPILADPGQIEQVIMNLVVNARDAMPTGGMLTIETSNAHLDDSYTAAQPNTLSGPAVLLAVTDTGCGMDEATLGQIFEPFFTTKEIGQGTGLGLATVYGIVKQSGGDITVYSEPNLGTTFKIYLPASVLATHPATPEPQPAFDGGHRQGGETILLVEDDERVRLLVRRLLEMEGYTLFEASDGDEALALLEQQRAPIDLLLTDVVMPGMSGRELAERLKALRPQVKVLFMSGYADDAVIRHGVLMAEAEFLAKPFQTGQLVAKVRQVLNK